MKSGKVLPWLIIGAVGLIVVSAGVVFGVLSLQEHNATRDLQAARSLMNQRQYDQAEMVLTGMTERAKGSEGWYRQLLALRLELFEAKGDDAGAKMMALELLDPQKKYEGEAAIRAHIYLARQQIKENSVEQAQPHFDAIMKLSGSTGFGADFATAGLTRIRFEKEGATPEMQKELEAVLEKFPDSEFKRDIEDALGACNMEALFTGELNEGDEIYELKKGDSLDTLSRKYKVSPEMLMRMNGVQSVRSLPIGRRMKIPRVDFSILVNKSDNTLTLMNNGKFFKKYTVRTGKFDYKTPVGDYVIQNKSKNPRWNDPTTGKSYPPNDPENELGTRWMGFKGSSLGIHGTIHPETLGSYASNGCVGMSMEEVEELYDLVPLGTPIKIIGKINKALIKDKDADKKESPKPDRVGSPSVPEAETNS